MMMDERKISDQFDKLFFKIRWIRTENIYSLTNLMQINNPKMTKKTC
jgi:hypothetical protein